MRIRRVTYDLGNVIERQEYLDGRYGAPGEKRAKKKKATPEEVEQVNQWTRERKARHRRNNCPSWNGAPTSERDGSYELLLDTITHITKNSMNPGRTTGKQRKRKGDNKHEI